MHPSSRIGCLGAQVAPDQSTIEIDARPTLCQKEELSAQPDCSNDIYVVLVLTYDGCGVRVCVLVLVLNPHLAFVSI